MQHLKFPQYSALTPAMAVGDDAISVNSSTMDSHDYQDVESTSYSSSSCGHESMDLTIPTAPSNTYVNITGESKIQIGDNSIFLRIFQWISPSVESGLDLEGITSRTREAALVALNNASFPVPDSKYNTHEKPPRRRRRYWVFGMMLTSIICIIGLIVFWIYDGGNLNPSIIGVNSGESGDFMVFNINGWISDMNAWSVMVFICFIHTTLSILNPLYQWVKDYRIRIATEEQYLLYPDLLPFAPRIMKRGTWLAQPPTHPLDDNSLPVERVIIIHTASADYNTSPDNCLVTRHIQMIHVESRKWFDISYNFLIGGDGCVYEGRGWDKVGDHTTGYNRGSLGIAFIGTYVNKLPRENQLEALSKLINLGVKLKKISENYKINVHCQLQSTLSPGPMLARHMATWDHFDSSLPIP